MTLRVFVAGATGVLGRRLVAELADRGHVAIGLTRDRAGDEAVAAAGGVPRRGDVLDRERLEWAAADADVVVHAASAVPTSPRPDEDDWRRDARVRRLGARNLTNAAATGAATRYVQACVVWVVRRDDGGAVEETATPNPDRTTRAAVAAERRARAAARFGLEPVILRCGWFYAADAGHTRRLARGLLAGRLPAVGGGLLGRRDAALSVVHPDDAARAFADAVEGSPPNGASSAPRGPGVAERNGTAAAGDESTSDRDEPAADGDESAVEDGGFERRHPGDRHPFGGGAGGRPGGGRPNTYHVVDEEPVAFSRFLAALADRLGARPPRRVPGWLARPFVGRDVVRFLTTGFPTTAERFRDDYGWVPEYPTYREGLDRVVDRWRESGALVEADGGAAWRGD